MENDVRLPESQRLSAMCCGKSRQSPNIQAAGTGRKKAADPKVRCLRRMNLCLELNVVVHRKLKRMRP